MWKRPSLKTLNKEQHEQIAHHYMVKSFKAAQEGEELDTLGLILQARNKKQEAFQLAALANNNYYVATLLKF